MIRRVLAVSVAAGVILAASVYPTLTLWAVGIGGGVVFLGVICLGVVGMVRALRRADATRARLVAEALCGDELRITGRLGATCARYTDHLADHAGPVIGAPSVAVMWTHAGDVRRVRPSGHIEPWDGSRGHTGRVGASRGDGGWPV